MAKAAWKIILTALIGLGSIAFSQSAAPPGKSATPMDDVVHTLFAATSFYQAAISSDGRNVAWVESSKDGPAIYVSETSAPRPRRITAGGHSEGAVAWSPDGRQIAFFSDNADPGQQQLYVTSLAGRATRKLTNVKRFLASPGWSPDGKT